MYQSTPQPISGEDDVPGTEGLEEWLLRLAGQTGESKSDDGSATHTCDPASTC